MNKHELFQELKRNNINPNTYSIIGETALSTSEQYVLDKSWDNWVVYYLERGERNHQKMFPSEDEACKYFLNLVLENAKYNATN